MERVFEWTPADHVFNSVQRIMWMKDHFLTAALISKDSNFRKYFVEDELSETRLLRLVLQLEGTVFPPVEWCAGYLSPTGAIARVLLASLGRVRKSIQ